MVFVSEAGQPQTSRFEIMRQCTCLVVVVVELVGNLRVKHGRLAFRSHKYLGPTNSNLRIMSIESTQ
jgi:hypothetical protein